MFNNRKAILNNAQSSYNDWNNEHYFESGEDIGEILIATLGPVEDHHENLTLW